MWLPEDTAYALAWQQLERDRCSGCGHQRDESFDAANQDGFTAEVLRCHGCAARDRASRQFAADKGDAAGVYVTVSRDDDT